MKKANIDAAGLLADGDFEVEDLVTAAMLRAGDVAPQLLPRLQVAFPSVWDDVQEYPRPILKPHPRANEVNDL